MHKKLFYKKMKQRRVSLKDLASQLGVSIATVSRALRNSHEVGEDMRSKVQQLARELNYRPNPFAQSLRKESPRIIGVVLPNMVTHYYASVLDGIENYARSKGYSVFSGNSHESENDEKMVIDSFVNMHVEGIIACISQDTTDFSHFIEVKNMGIPLVFFARTCLHDEFSSVVADGDVAAQKATQHLINNGCRRIAFVGGPNHLDMVRRRKHGYLEALRENKIPIDRELVACDKIDFQIAYDATMKLFDKPNCPDAILAFNDVILYGVFEAVKDKGLRIPEDVALAGFSNSNTAEYVTPRLTTIVDHAFEQGQKACEILLNAINGDKNIHHEVVPMKLIIRESSKRL